ncbi:MAG: FAD-dependent oxidoreductase [Acidobacteriota bacterium]|nr:FAD-dependent oxidoreductase [Acidobacteriota bacterium]
MSNGFGFSRRTFLGGMAAAAALPATPGIQSDTKPHVAVIGAGAFGGWSALHLLRRGARVTLLDAWGPGNSRASSGGEGRAIRAVYGPDRIYSEMVLRAYELWEALARDTGRKIYEETGALWMMGKDDSYVRAALPILADLGFPVENPGVAEAAKRWPQIDFSGVVNIYLEKRAGALMAREACAVVRDRFVSEGGDWRQAHVRPGKIENNSMQSLDLGDGSRLTADHYLFACGPWLGSLFPDVIGEAVRPTRQEVYYFGTSAGRQTWLPGALPIWIDFGRKIYYGFPDIHGRGFKFADDTRGAPIDPSTAERQLTPTLLAEARRFISRRFPGLADAPLLESRVCQYENSPDGHLILDRHSKAANVWLAGGGSGHGFKLAPAVGEMLAESILKDVKTEPMFGIDRLGRTSKGTQFEKK